MKKYGWQIQYPADTSERCNNLQWDRAAGRIVGGIAALAAGGVFLVGAAAATAVKMGMAIFLAGSLYVEE